MYVEYNCYLPLQPYKKYAHPDRVAAKAMREALTKRFGTEFTCKLTWSSDDDSYNYLLQRVLVNTESNDVASFTHSASILHRVGIDQLRNVIMLDKDHEGRRML